MIELASDVHTARRAVDALRGAPLVPDDVSRAQHALLQALEAYASELTVRRLPIPYRLRDRLRLQRQFDQWPTRTTARATRGPRASAPRGRPER